jgi:hypothetical protein
VVDNEASVSTLSSPLALVDSTICLTNNREKDREKERKNKRRKLKRQKFLHRKRVFNSNK